MLGSSVSGEQLVPSSPEFVVRQDPSTVVLASTLILEDSMSCSTSVLTTMVIDLPFPIRNSHSMVTCAKVGIFKPKIFTTEVQEREPRTIEEAFAFLE